jgi:hypothetical protein
VTAIDWGQIFVWFAREYPSWSREDVGRLTWDQMIAYLYKGKDPNPDPLDLIAPPIPMELFHAADPTALYAEFMKRGRKPETVPIRYGGTMTEEQEQRAKVEHNAKARAEYEARAKARNTAFQTRYATAQMGAT